MSVKTKIAVARFKLFFTKKRYMGNHPKSKKFITVAFLVVVNSFILWNLSLNIPTIEINFPTGNIVVENKVLAKEPVEEKVVEKQKEIETCADAVAVYGAQYGNTDLLGRIVKAESNGNSTAENTKSTSAGCSQFTIGSWRFYGKQLWGDKFFEKNIYDPANNVELMAYTISLYGTSPWDASKSVWGK